MFEPGLFPGCLIGLLLGYQLITVKSAWKDRSVRGRSFWVVESSPGSGPQVDALDKADRGLVIDLIVVIFQG